MCGLSHPHVLGLIRIALNSSNSPHLLLPFMENGDLKTFLKKTRKVGVVGSSEYPKVMVYVSLGNRLSNTVQNVPGGS